MTQDPTLIIQLQRMGDLILSFPLFTRLLFLEPERPLWVVAEPRFCKELLSIAPGVVFFDLSMAPLLQEKQYKRVINLSHRPVALDFAGTLKTNVRIGAFRQGSSIYIKGLWRLYRSSIVYNNRHNLFHWSDLESLGLIPEKILRGTQWPSLRKTGQSGHIGLFIGASEPSKRPDPQFWGQVAQHLIQQGLSPVFLGGPDDIILAAEAIKFARLDNSRNFVGKFDLSNLVLFFQELDLLVTSDTGPMHLAAWTGTPVLDLSMGNVNPWETAPAPLGHTVVKAAMSCVGCWQCDGRSFICRQAFTPEKIGKLILSLIENTELEQASFSGLRLYQTDRDERGLFVLKSFFPEIETQRALLGSFWQEWFIAMLGGASDRLSLASELLFEQAPYLCIHMKKNITKISRELAKVLKKTTIPLSKDFWLNVPPSLKPFSGYIDLLLQNGEYTYSTWEKVLYLASSLAKIL